MTRRMVIPHCLLDRELIAKKTQANKRVCLRSVTPLPQLSPSLAATHYINKCLRKELQASKCCGVRRSRAGFHCIRTSMATTHARVNHLSSHLTGIIISDVVKCQKSIVAFSKFSLTSAAQSDIVMCPRLLKKAAHVKRIELLISPARYPTVSVCCCCPLIYNQTKWHVPQFGHRRHP